MPHNIQAKGFTLLELIIVLAILAIFITMAAPAWGNFMSSQHHNIAVNKLLNAFRFTRSEAIKSGQRITVCTRNGPSLECGGSSWSDGWLIFTDLNNNGVRESGEAILKQYDPLYRQVVATGNRSVKSYISYTPMGVTRRASSDRIRGSLQLGTLSVCTKGMKQGHKLVINRSGRVLKRNKKDC